MRSRRLVPARLIAPACGIVAGLFLLASPLLALPQFPNPVFPVGSNPYGMVKADFDGDGIDDLIVSNAGEAIAPSDLSFLRGLGDGTFASQVKIPVSGDPLDVFSADFNGDGWPDLAVYYSSGAAYLFNQGQGIFGPENPLPTDLRVRALEMGDFIGDGSEELLVYGDLGGQHFFQMMFFNGIGFGGGQVVPAGSYNTYASPFFYMKVADFTGDGKDDVAVTTNIHSGTSDILIYPSRGDGTFLPPTQLTVQGNCSKVLPAELNNDGRTDLVYETSDDFLLYGRGDGTFDPGPTLPALGEPLLSVVAGDLNGDGVQDFVAASWSGFRVYLGQGGGTFAAQPVNWVGNINFQVLLGDLQGDGLPDLIMLANRSEAVFTFLGNGDGSFGPKPVDTLQYAPVGAVGVGDFNGDGRLDLAAGRVDSSQVSVLLGNGDGTFGPEALYPGGVGPISLEVGDFDSDGRADLAEAVLNYPYADPNPIPPGTLLVSKGNGDGTFSPPVAYATGPRPVKTSVSDFNGDGVQDIAVLDFGDMKLIQPDLRVYLGNPGSLFTPMPPRPVNSAPTDLAVGDFNRDGVPDLVVISSPDYGYGSADLLLGNGDGTFQDPTFVAQFTNPRGVGAADLNGDGMQDLVVADEADGFPSNPGGVSVFLGQGDGTFAPGVALIAGVGPYHLSLGDFDGNSTIDLFVETGSGYEAFFPGRGDGTFDPLSLYGLYGAPTILGSFDFNGDHRGDLLALSSMGVFVIEQHGPTQVFDIQATPSALRMRRTETVDWSTDQERDLEGFNLLAVSPGGRQTLLNREPIACVECTTGNGHSYSASVRAIGWGQTVYVEVLFHDGHTALFGPGEIAPKRAGPGLKPASDPSPFVRQKKP